MPEKYQESLLPSSALDRSKNLSFSRNVIQNANVASVSLSAGFWWARSLSRRGGLRVLRASSGLSPLAYTFQTVLKIRGTAWLHTTVRGKLIGKNPLHFCGSPLQLSEKAISYSATLDRDAALKNARNLLSPSEKTWAFAAQ